MSLRLAWKTDPGLHREENEDSVLVWEGRAGLDALLLVCDGMGGHAAGSRASTLAIETMSEALLNDGREGADRERLVTAFASANAAVYEASRRVTEWAGMGSTVTALAIRGHRLALLNVGDSPAYLIRDGEIHPIAQDHSWPAEQVRLGIIRPEEASEHPYKHRLTRAVGIWDQVQPFTALIELEPGDVLAVCSDGIETAGIEKEEVRDLLAGDDLEAGVEAIMRRCLDLGGPDNLTLAVARLLPEGPDDSPTVLLPAPGPSPGE